MGKKVLTFGDIEIEKKKIYRRKSHASIRDIDMEKVLVSNKVSSGKKIYK